MFQNVFVKQMRDERYRLAFWSLGVGVGSALMMFIWPSIRDMPDIERFLAEYPEAMRELFNVEGITSPAGFLNAEIFSLLLPGLFLIFAIARGASLVAGEEEAGTLELVLATPVARTRFALEKVASLVTSLLVLSAAVWLALWVSAVMVGADLPAMDLAGGVAAMGLLGLEHGLFALAIGLATGSKAWATGAASAVAVSGYLLYVASAFVEAIEPFRVISPIHHALNGGPVGAGWPAAYLLMPLVGVIALAVSLPIFARRDIGA